MKNYFYIKTLGCKVNQYESQVMRENLLKDGYLEAKSMDEAGIFVVNTCTVTSKTDSKSLHFIHNAIKKGKCVVATGCMIENEELYPVELKGVRFIIKNKDKSNISKIMNIDKPVHPSAHAPDEIPLLEPEKFRSGFSLQPSASIITGFSGHTRVFLKIQDGCDNVCSYCKVRIVRGRSQSRPFTEILNEAKGLIENGAKEIVLSGICMGSYGRDTKDGKGLPELIDELCKIKGDWRMRLSSIEPKDITDDLIERLKTQKKLCPHLHIPFQSGDDYILKKMDRPYARDCYLKIVEKLKNAIPDIAISTDIMVGFPEETEERFESTLELIKLIRPMRMHIFPFSKREGTKAYNYEGEVSLSVKKDREYRLLSLSKDMAGDFIKGFIGKEVDILVEDKRSKDGRLQGYTERYIKAHIDGPDNLKGKFVRRRLEKRHVQKPARQ